MSDSSYQIAPASTGPLIDLEQVTTGAGTVLRQVVVLGDDTTGAARVRILNTAPAGTEYGVVVRNIPGGTQAVSGTVTINAPMSGSVDAQTAAANQSIALLGYNGTTWDRLRVDGNATGVLRVTTGGASTTAVAAGTSSNTVIKGSSGRLYRVLVTAVGTAALNIYDNATTNTGTVVCAIPASAAVGSIYFLEMPCANGITVGGVASCPGITLSWS